MSSRREKRPNPKFADESEPEAKRQDTRAEPARRKALCASAIIGKPSTFFGCAEDEESLSYSRAYLEQQHVIVVARPANKLQGEGWTVDKHPGSISLLAFMRLNTSMTPEEAIQIVIDAKRLLGCDLFVLDCLMQIDLGGELENEKRFMAKLGAVAREYDMAIVVVHHMRKPQGPEGEKKVPGRESFIGSSHLVNAAAGVLILWQNAEKAAARHNGEEVDDNFPDFVLSVAKNRFAPFQGTVGLYQHKEARLLCNSRTRQYKPIIMEDICQSDESSTGGSASEDIADGLTRKTTHGLTPRTEHPTQRTGTAFLSWQS